MRASVVFFFAMAVFVTFSCTAYAGIVERTDQLGQDFQGQAPWSRERPQSGETPSQAQPGDYTAPPEREKTEPASPPQGSDYPLCFDPYTRTYERCYPEGSDYWRQRYSSPEFRYWWDHGHSCPSGYYFRSGWGCYRH